MGNKVDTMSVHIENAKKTGAFSYVGKKLLEIPVAVIDLAPNVRTMDFSNNRLKLLPKEFGKFVHLKQLNAEHNEIASVPKEFSQLKKLEVLQLGYNRIIELPQQYSNFANLKSIHLQNNRLTIFPDCLCQIKTLNVIDMSENQIEKLPEHMETLQAIELNLNRNRLSSLPESLTVCPRLKVLRVEENVLEISAITSDFLKNSQISLLAIDGNMFQMKELVDKDGYDKYMERFTATKKKFY